MNRPLMWLFPIHPIITILKRRSILTKGNLDKAIRYLKQALILNPDSLYLLKELAGLHLRQKDNQSTLGVIERVLQKDPDDIEALAIFAKIKQNLGQTEDAKDAYQRIILKAPESKNIYLLLGGLYLDESDSESALRIYRQLLERFPDSYAGHFFVGKIYAGQGQLQAAENEFLKTLELNSNLEEPRFELIALYTLQGKNEKILKMYKDILAISPRHVRASLELGLLFPAAGRRKGGGTPCGVGSAESERFAHRENFCEDLFGSKAL